MFICEECLKAYKNISFALSHGKCELCDEVHTCYDIPSKYLVKKEMIDAKTGMPVNRDV